VDHPRRRGNDLARSLPDDKEVLSPNASISVCCRQALPLRERRFSRETKILTSKLNSDIKCRCGAPWTKTDGFSTCFEGSSALKRLSGGQRNPPKHTP
jgi:hypothetical protein